MGKKTLIFLCDSYPLSAGEFFIDDEMRVIASRFENVVIYTASVDSGKKLNRYVPENAEVISFSRQKLETCKLKSIFRIFKPMFISEFFFAMKKLPLKYWLSAFKIMYVDIHRATNLKKELIYLCENLHLNISDCIFYSYWHDYKALALAMLRQKCGSVCVARAHGWDNFAERNKNSYLSFKGYIIQNLSSTFTISELGKKYFETYLGRNIDDRVCVSRLGKMNKRFPKLKLEEKNEYLFCSCSHFNAIKRVHLIAEIFSQMKTSNIKWVHFGWGYKESEDMVKKTIAEKIPNLNYEFKGLVPNDDILDFYSDNYIDMFFNVSSTEGIPVSIMEAMSAGIPVVATDVGGTSEIVNENNGYLIDIDFDPYQVAEIIDSHLRRTSIDQEEYRKEAYSTWKNNYDAEGNYNNFVDIILNLK